MWVKKKITLLPSAPKVDSNIIHLEDLDMHEKGLSIIEQAKAQAVLLLEKANEEAALSKEKSIECHEALLQEQRKNQEESFLLQAQAFFNEWETQRQEWSKRLLPRLENLLVDALTQILNEQPMDIKVSSMLSHLNQVLDTNTGTTLYYSSDISPEIKKWLATHPELNWTCKIDQNLPNVSLRLENEKSEIPISWQSLCKKMTQRLQE